MLLLSTSWPNRVLAVSRSVKDSVSNRYQTAVKPAPLPPGKQGRFNGHPPMPREAVNCHLNEFMDEHGRTLPYLSDT